MSQYYAETLVKFRLPVAALCAFDDNGSSDGGSFYYNPLVLTAQQRIDGWMKRASL